MDDMMGIEVMPGAWKTRDGEYVSLDRGSFHDFPMRGTNGYHYKKDGMVFGENGAAHPKDIMAPWNGPIPLPLEDNRLRDQFAIAALTGYLAYFGYHPDFTISNHGPAKDSIPKSCYAYADAMIKVRKL